jgi:Fe2+ or Zn2+ uptake regulation protein
MYMSSQESCEEMYVYISTAEHHVITCENCREDVDIDDCCVMNYF